MGRSLAHMARQVPARIGSWAWTPVLRQLGALTLEALAESWLDRQARSAPRHAPQPRPATVATRSRTLVVARSDQPGRALVVVEQVQVRVQPPPGQAER
jgi:hypothetical protein